jgi:LysM repeat protein
MIKLLIIAVSFLNPQVRDSLGIETINGKVFVIHKVAEKETLYGISRRYGAPIDAVMQYNPTASSGLEIGQILKIPYTPKTSVSKVPTTTNTGTTHVVAEKETLFSIAKAYGITVDELKQWNNLTTNALSLGQELIVKKRSTAGVNNTTQPNTTINTSVTGKKGSTHTVMAKETMFSISKQYGITIQQLKDWNNIQGNEISIDQVLYVAPPDDAVATKQNTTVNQPVAEVKQNSNQVNTPVADVKKADPQPVKEVKTPPREPTITISEAVRGSDEILESGIAELIEGTDGNRKYLALHRTAPVGTILKVKNEMNNREVFVRVMGKLPDTGLKDKLIIKISKSAYDRLGAIDQRFRVQLTYYK